MIQSITSTLVVIIILLTLFNNHIYGQTSYYYVSTSKSWTAGESYCLATYGTHLATITNESDYNAASESCVNSRCWIGLFRRSYNICNDSFAWSSNSSSSYRNWVTCNPDNYNGNENCGELLDNSVYKGFNDVACTQAQAFLCDTRNYTSETEQCPTTPTYNCPTPTSVPTKLPSRLPTKVPSSLPSSNPTLVPSSLPSSNPTLVPISTISSGPTHLPTSVPSILPSLYPTSVPTKVIDDESSTPTSNPTMSPITNLKSDTKDDNNDLNDGTIAGIVIGITVGVLIFCFIIYSCILSSRQRNEKKEQDHGTKLTTNNIVINNADKGETNGKTIMTNDSILTFFKVFFFFLSC